MFTNDEEDDSDIAQLKRLFIDLNVDIGCKRAYLKDEYINIKVERKKLTEKLLSYISRDDKNAVENILNDISSTFNHQSSVEFDSVLGNIFDKINMLPILTSEKTLKDLSLDNQN